MKIPVLDDLKKCIDSNKELSNQHKNSPTLFGMKYFALVLEMLPFNLGHQVVAECTKKLTMNFTGMPGPREPLTFAGSKMLAASGCLGRFA